MVLKEVGDEAAHAMLSSPSPRYENPPKELCVMYGLVLNFSTFLEASMLDKLTQKGEGRGGGGPRQSFNCFAVWEDHKGILIW